MKPPYLISALLCSLLLLFPPLAHSGDTPARTLSLDEAAGLADRREFSERLYLRGEFRVTASGTSRAVLRDAKRPNEQSPRVVVEYPPGTVAPRENEHFVRDAAHPYLIIGARRDKDRVVTIYVRETFSTDTLKYL